MRQHPFPTRRQRGAIAVMTGLLMLLVLIPVGGLVLDLGHLYVAKSELQNLADAAALAAAKDLDNSTDGVTKAFNAGKAVTAQNRYDFSSTLTLNESNFRFASSPDGPWYSLDDTKTNPAGRTFVEINTKVGGYAGTPQTIDTYLMRVAGTDTTATFGAAVAGRFVNNVTPIGVCAVDPTTRSASYDYGGGLTELVEYGFRRGVTYNIFTLGRLNAKNESDPYQINPVNAPPGTCDQKNSSAENTAPFMCTGDSAVLPVGAGQVFTNTGVSASLEKALNSRFNDFGNGSQCDASSAPPDVNVKEFPCKKGSADCAPGGTVADTPPINWMETGADDLPNTTNVATLKYNSLETPRYALPSEAAAAGATVGPTIQVPRMTSASPATTPATFADYGPIWSYAPPVQSNGSTVITPAQANGTAGGSNKMYGSSPSGDYITAANYPTAVGSGFPANTAPSPYNQTGDINYFLAPAGRTGVINRRILNIVLIDCRTPPSATSCGTMTAVGIGKFFMTQRADFSGNPKKLFVEFTGLVEPVPTSQVKLYK